MDVTRYSVEHVPRLNTYAYMTEAPPPATIVQMRPAGFKTVSFSDAPLLASRSAMYASCHGYTVLVQHATSFPKPHRHIGWYWSPFINPSAIHQLTLWDQIPDQCIMWHICLLPKVCHWYSLHTLQESPNYYNDFDNLFFSILNEQNFGNRPGSRRR